MSASQAMGFGTEFFGTELRLAHAHGIHACMTLRRKAADETKVLLSPSPDGFQVHMPGTLPQPTWAQQQHTNKIISNSISNLPFWEVVRPILGQYRPWEAWCTAGKGIEALLQTALQKKVRGSAPGG